MKAPSLDGLLISRTSNTSTALGYLCKWCIFLSCPHCSFWYARNQFSVLTGCHTSPSPKASTEVAFISKSETVCQFPDRLVCTLQPPARQITLKLINQRPITGTFSLQFSYQRTSGHGKLFSGNIEYGPLMTVHALKVRFNACGATTS